MKKPTDPVLLAEIPAPLLDAEMLGRTLARLLFVCDLLLDESLVWLHPGARKVPPIAPSTEVDPIRARSTRSVRGGPDR